MKNAVRFAAIALFASTVAFASVASAEGKSLSQTLTGSAKTEFDAGIALYESGDYGASVIKFRAAYEQSKDNRLLWNIANCERLLHHYVKARKLVREYVANGGTAISNDDKNSAKQFLEITESAVSEVKFEIAEPGVEISVDGEVVGTTPLASAQLDVGKHTVSLKKEGFATQEIPLVVVGGAGAAVKAEMARAVGHLSVSAGSSDDIEIDGKFVAKGSFEGDLPKGQHNIRVSSPGTNAYDGHVDLGAGEHRSISVALRSSGSKIPLWAWIAGGAALGTGAVVGGYYLFKPGVDNGAGTFANGYATVR